jgi:hypothetical protein
MANSGLKQLSSRSSLSRHWEKEVLGGVNLITVHKEGGDSSALLSWEWFAEGVTQHHFWKVHLQVQGLQIPCLPFSNLPLAL